MIELIRKFKDLFLKVLEMDKWILNALIKLENYDISNNFHILL
jgi:hypothetical protein